MTVKDSRRKNKEGAKRRYVKARKGEKRKNMIDVISG